MTEQDQADFRPTFPPENIDEIALESNSIWIGVARNYKSIAARNKQLQEHQLNLNKRLEQFTTDHAFDTKKKKELYDENARLRDDIKGLQMEIANLKKKLKAKKTK